jgi:hypothetical protein
VAEEQSRGRPTVRRMLLGAQLRRLRVDAGVSREEAGEALLRCAGPGQSEVGWSARDQIAKTSSSNATDSRRL